MAQRAETLNWKLKEKALVGYIALILDLTPAEIVLAFFRAANEGKFMHVPASLRDFASVTPSGDPIANEGREELFRIVAAMRGPHGPKLQTIRGKVKYGSAAKPEVAKPATASKGGDQLIKKGDAVTRTHLVAPEAVRISKQSIQNIHCANLLQCTVR